MTEDTEPGFDPNMIFIPLLNASFAHLLANDNVFTPFQPVSTIESTRHYSTMISLTGSASVMLLLNFDYAIAWYLMQEEVRDLGLEHNEETLEAVLAEVTNIIGGNATASLAGPSQTVHLSLPLTFRCAKMRPGLNQVFIQRTTLAHKLGKLDVYCVTPAIPDVFETK